MEADRAKNPGNVENAKKESTDMFVLVFSLEKPLPTCSPSTSRV